jgi:hypothetical protein
LSAIQPDSGRPERQLWRDRIAAGAASRERAAPSWRLPMKQALAALLAAIWLATAGISPAI